MLLTSSGLALWTGSVSTWSATAVLLIRFSCSLPSHSVHSGVLGCTLTVKRGTSPVSQGSAGADLLHHILKQGAASHDTPSWEQTLLYPGLQNCASVPTNLAPSAGASASRGFERVAANGECSSPSTQSSRRQGEPSLELPQQGLAVQHTAVPCLSHSPAAPACIRGREGLLGSSPSMDDAG